MAVDIRVEHLDVDIGADGTTTTLANDVGSLSSAFFKPNTSTRHMSSGPTGSTGNSTPIIVSAAGELTATNTITWRRANSTTVKMMGEVWRYVGQPGGDNEFVVRWRGMGTVSGSPGYVDIDLSGSGISNISDCVPFIGGVVSTSTGTSDYDTTGAGCYLWDNSGTPTLRIRRDNTQSNAIDVYVQVVEFTGANWTIGHGFADDPGETASVTLNLYDTPDGSVGNAVDVADWSTAFIVGQHGGDTNETGLADVMALFYPGANTSSVTCSFQDADGGARNDSFAICHVVKHPDLIVLREVDTNLSEGNGSYGLLPWPTGSRTVGSSTMALEWYVSTSGTGTAHARGALGLRIVPAVDGDPEPPLTPDQTYVQNDPIDSSQYDSSLDALWAIDISFPATPSGAIVEGGGSGTGFFVGFNDTTGDFVARWGNGGTLDPTDAAKITLPASAFANKSGRLYVQFNVALGSIDVWWDRDTTGELDQTYVNVAASVPSNWSGGDGGGCGYATGSVSGPEVTTPATFNGTITEARLYNGNYAAVGAPGQALLQHWVHRSGNTVVGRWGVIDLEGIQSSTGGENYSGSFIVSVNSQSLLLGSKDANTSVGVSGAEQMLTVGSKSAFVIFQISERLQVAIQTSKVVIFSFQVQDSINIFTNGIKGGRSPPVLHSEILQSSISVMKNATDGFLNSSTSAENFGGSKNSSADGIYISSTVVDNLFTQKEVSKDFQFSLGANLTIDSRAIVGSAVVVAVGAQVDFSGAKGAISNVVSSDNVGADATAQKEAGGEIYPQASAKLTILGASTFEVGIEISTSLQEEFGASHNRIGHFSVGMGPQTYVGGSASVESDVSFAISSKVQQEFFVAKSTGGSALVSEQQSEIDIQSQTARNGAIDSLSVNTGVNIYSAKSGSDIFTFEDTISELFFGHKEAVAASSLSLLSDTLVNGFKESGEGFNIFAVPSISIVFADFFGASFALSESTNLSFAGRKNSESYIGIYEYDGINIFGYKSVLGSLLLSEGISIFVTSDSLDQRVGSFLLSENVDIYALGAKHSGESVLLSSNFSGSFFVVKNASVSILLPTTEGHILFGQKDARYQLLAVVGVGISGTQQKHSSTEFAISEGINLSTQAFNLLVFAEPNFQLSGVSGVFSFGHINSNVIIAKMLSNLTLSSIEKTISITDLDNSINISNISAKDIVASSRQDIKLTEVLGATKVVDVVGTIVIGGIDGLILITSVDSDIDITNVDALSSVSDVGAKINFY